MIFNYYETRNFIFAARSLIAYEEETGLDRLEENLSQENCALARPRSAFNEETESLSVVISAPRVDSRRRTLIISLKPVTRG